MSNFPRLHVVDCFPPLTNLSHFLYIHDNHRNAWLSAVNNFGIQLLQVKQVSTCSMQTAPSRVASHYENAGKTIFPIVYPSFSWKWHINMSVYKHSVRVSSNLNLKSNTSLRNRENSALSFKTLYIQKMKAIMHSVRSYFTTTEQS